MSGPTPTYAHPGWIERRKTPMPEDIGTQCWECGHARGEHDEKECRGGEDLPCRCDSFVEPVECAEPHQGCGCEKDASQGAHEGPCDYDGGYGQGGATVLCTPCLDAIHEHKRTACPDCGGAGWVAVAAVSPMRRRTDNVRVTGAREERCMACLGTGRKTA